MKRLDLSVGHRLAIGFAAVAALLAGLVAFSLVLLHGIEQRNRRLQDDVAPSAALVERLERDILTRAIALRTYALTGDPQQYDEFRKLNAETRALLADASRISGDLPGTKPLASIREREMRYGQALDALVSGIQRQAAPGEIAMLESSAEQTRVDLLEPIAESRAALVAERRRSRLEVGASVRTVRRTLWSTSAAILLILVVTGTLTALGIRRPVARLVSAARALSKGDFARAIQLADSPRDDGPIVHDELRQLSLDFGQMARALAEATENLRNQNEELQVQREEIQAQNEEIQAQNEELQAQNEELQAQGEELRAQGDELRTTVEALTESEERFRRAVTSAPFPVMLHDEDGRVRALSASWTRETGFTQAEISTVDDWVRKASRAEQGRERALHSGLGAFDRGVLEGEYPIRTKAGQDLIWHLGSAPLGEVAGKRLVISMAVDVTAQRQAETELRQADARKDEFLAMLSHELRNPLAPIRNGLHILEHAPDDSPQAERARTVVDRQVAHLTRLVDDLLDITRITAGKIRLQRSALNLSHVLQKAADDAEALFSTGEIEFSVSLPDEPILVDGDTVRLAQVVGNLLHNAVKFTPKGRVTLALEKDEKQELAVIRVADTGLGIEPEVCARLFEPFTQGERTLARSSGGLGLGLALVKALVGLHGGRVELYSAGKNQGSEFVVMLPIVEQPAPVLAAPAVGARRGRRILVIEDNQDAADSLSDLLTLQGHTVDVAYDGARGLEKAKELTPEVVLCDVGLPGKDGYAVARALRSDPELGDVLLVAITGYALEEDRRRVLASGFHAHLAKPIELNDLEDLLASPDPIEP